MATPKGKKKGGAKRWTEQEVHFLRSQYTTQGAKLVAEKMPGRTAAAVKSKAMMLRLNVGDIKGWVPVSYVANEIGFHINTVRERAERTGVARIVKSGKRNLKVLVPEAWAEAYIQSAKRAQEAEKLKGHHYDLKTTARIFGVHPQTLRKWLYGEPPESEGAKLMSRIRFVTTSGIEKRSFLFNPYDVEREAKIYHAKKAEQEKG